MTPAFRVDSTARSDHVGSSGRDRWRASLRRVATDDGGLDLAACVDSFDQ
jgi:hypothetical protein